MTAPCLRVLGYMILWYERINVNTFFFQLVILLLTFLLTACSYGVKENDTDLRIGDLKPEPNITFPKSTSSPTYSGSLENYRAYLKSKENTLYRDKALLRLAELELEESETVTRQMLQHQTEKTARSVSYSIDHYKEYLRLYPDKDDNDFVLYQLAKAYEFIGDTDNALSTLDTIVQRFPTTLYIDEIQFRRGEILFVFNDYASSEKAYSAIVTDMPSSQFLEKAQYKLAWSQFKQTKYRDSLESCISLLDRMQSQGEITNTSVVTGLERSDSDFINDVLRVMSLSFSYRNGTETIRSLLADKPDKSYEPLLYLELARLYLKTERTIDAANVYLDYAKLHPHTLQSAEFHVLAIKTYANAGLVEPLIVTKVDLVKNFGLGSKFWAVYDAPIKESVKIAIKTSIYDLAKYYHAVALKTDISRDYIAASYWYDKYIRSFPDDPTTPMMNFLMAESQYDAKRYRQALNEYLKTAYNYKLHSKSAEAGYAAILTYKVLITNANKKEKGKLKSAALNNAIQFSLKFKNSSYAAAVISKTAETLYNNKDYKVVVSFAQKNTHLKYLADQSYFKNVWLVYAHSLFELEEFNLAEKAYIVTRDLLDKNSKLYVQISEKLAASIYMQGKQYYDNNNFELASKHFLRVGGMVPESKIHATAEYDAATALILLKRWQAAAYILEGFREKFPDHKKYKQGISEKLVLAYTETKQSNKAANEALFLSKKSSNINERKDYMWMAAELYQDSGLAGKANTVYMGYVKKYRDPFVQNITAHQRIIDYYRSNNDKVNLKKWLTAVVNAEKAGKNNRTDETKFIAANAALEMTDSLVADFKRVELKVPLKKSLRTKKSLMEKALKAFSELMTYGIADITTASTYHVADIYGHFAENLINSQRPKNLNAEELEQYDILLEEQAYPFEEKSIDIHSANAKRTSTGLYDMWVKKSIEALTVLQPVRYAKTERLESYVANSY